MHLGEGLVAEDRLQFQGMLHSGLGPLRVLTPLLDRHAHLVSDPTQQQPIRLGINGKQDSGISHVAELNGKAQSVRWPSPFIGQRRVRIAERVAANQVLGRCWQFRQTFSIGRRQDGTKGHHAGTALRSMARRGKGGRPGYGLPSGGAFLDQILGPLVAGRIGPCSPLTRHLG